MAYTDPKTTCTAVTETVRSERSTVCVVIPALNPGPALLELVDGLSAADFEHIVVVDDGSAVEYRSIFDDLDRNSRCVVLRHAVNCGKGRALKTAMNFVYLNYPDATGVLTVDADGQHAPEDCGRVADAFLAAGTNKLMLGVRLFDHDVPLRSRLGNTITRSVFRYLSGERLADTQTGLRAVPRSAIPGLLVLPGERYEYEMNMLIESGRHALKIEQLPIQTLYYDGNKGSNFNPLLDSMRIYFVLLRFFSSSIAAAVVDFVAFAVLFGLTGNVLGSLITARFAFGSLFNFFLNRSFVFRSDAGSRAALVKYYVLVIANVAAAYAIMSFLGRRFGVPVLAAKIMVEMPLSLVSFAIQRTYVFGRQTNE